MKQDIGETHEEITRKRENTGSKTNYTHKEKISFKIRHKLKTRQDVTNSILFVKIVKELQHNISLMVH